MNNVSSLLEREDKWYLGFGEKLVWTPTHPVFLEKLGFWDPANFYDMKISPCYTLDILDENHEVLTFENASRKWYPNLLKSTYEADLIEVIEAKSVIKNTLVSEIILKNRITRDIKLHLVAWGVGKQEEKEKVEDFQVLDNGIYFLRIFKRKNGKDFVIHTLFGSKIFDSYQVSSSSNSYILPRYVYTPFYDNFGGILKNRIIYSDKKKGMIYFAFHKEITIPKSSTERFVIAMSMDTSFERTKQHFEEVLKIRDLGNLVDEEWKEYFSKLPAFNTDNEYFRRYYWYRWYGLKLFSIDVKEGNYKYPIVLEGPDYFRTHITYSAQCHMREMRWGLPEYAEGSFLNFVVNQKEDGSFPGHVFVDGIHRMTFYHANWGRSCLEVFFVTRNPDFLKKVYPSLCRYAEYMDRARDKENTNMYDVIDQFETGQEFSSRYLAVDEMADEYNWINAIRLKGIDATVYVYELKKSLSVMARFLGKEDDSKMWEEEARKIRETVRERMWDPETEMFYDVDPTTWKTTGVKAAVCFYPYMTDIATKEHLEGLKKHLFNPKEFWTEYPVPTLSLDDPFFNPNAEWKGKRLPCPWNGRVWPMTNSHIVEALGNTARRFEDEYLKEKTVELLEKFVKMLFENGDPKKPNCYEHYNPFNGRPSFYRGVDDYQHSWIIDLFFKYIVGLFFSEDGTLFFDPFPFGWNFEVANLKVAGEVIEVSKRDDVFTVKVSGKEVFHGRFEGKIPIIKFT